MPADEIFASLYGVMEEVRPHMQVLMDEKYAHSGVDAIEVTIFHSVQGTTRAQQQAHEGTGEGICPLIGDGS